MQRKKLDKAKAGTVADEEDLKLKGTAKWDGREQLLRLGLKEEQEINLDRTFLKE